MGLTTIGSSLKSRRRDLGIDQSDAAAQIGMSRTTFSSYERDLQRPSAEVLPALAQFLNVTIEELLTLYGATCIEAMRPSLERFLDSHEATSSTTVGPISATVTPETPTGAPTAAAPHGDDPVSIEPNVVQEVQAKEPLVSIFANELSNDAEPGATEAIAITPGEDFSSPDRPSSSKPKKKKKKKGHKK